MSLQGQRTRAWRAVGLVSAGVLAVANSVGVVTPAAAAPVPVATLSLPATVALGDPVAVEVAVSGAEGLRGLEVALRYDGRRVDYGGSRLLTGGLAPASRLRALPVAPHVAGVDLGIYDCGAVGCGDGVRDAGGGGFAEVQLEPVRAGRVQVALSSVTGVDAQGRRVRVRVTGGVRTVRVGGGEASVGAPAARAERLDRRSRRTPDLDSDGAVTAVDLLTAEAAWAGARSDDDPCSDAAGRFDADGDGCADVSDVLTVLGAVDGGADGVAAEFEAADPTTAWAPSGAARSVAATSDDGTAAGAAAADPVPVRTFVVNSTGDAVDRATGDGICEISGSPGTCTLRAALGQANASAGHDRIVFDIPGTGPHTLTPGSRYPFLVDPAGVTIDGSTQPGSRANTHATVSNAVLNVQIRGTGPSGIDLFFIASPHNVFRGLALYDARRALWFNSVDAHDNVVVSSFLGTNAAGTFRWSSIVSGSSAVVLQGGSADNRIGRPVLADRNVLSGASHHAVVTIDDGTTRNVLQNNVIGLNPAGTAALPNGSHGVDVNTYTTYTLIGGTGPLERNVISGNVGEGVEVSHNAGTRYNEVVGNLIGTDTTGTAAPAWAANRQRGVRLEGGPPSYDNVVTDNVIVNNDLGGLVIDRGASRMRVQRNKIGVLADGTPAPNGFYGIRIESGAGDNLIGPGNEVAHNPGGITITSEHTVVAGTPQRTWGNTITRNSIHDNGGPGIDLEAIGTRNVNDDGDLDDGANEQLNHPVVTDATSQQLTGTACAGCTVEAFVADAKGQADGTRWSGAGETFVGSATAGSSGTFTLALAAEAAGRYVSTTATNARGSTSEFSRNVLVPEARTGGTPPTAVIAVPTCDGLRCTFDGSGSSDADGPIASYAWELGDGSTATGAIVTHTFATVGTRTVTLLVRDGSGATDTETVEVTVTNTAPIAEIAPPSCSALTCTFDGTGSSDADGTIASYAWKFGDGSTATGPQPTHTYAAAGTYTVSLTVTDSAEGSGSTTRSTTVSAPPADALVADSFSRTVTGGWGTADAGGQWSVPYGSSALSTNGTVGVIEVPAGRSRQVNGAQTPIADTDLRAVVAQQVLPSAGSAYAFASVRGQDAESGYRLRARVLPDRSLRVALLRVAEGTATEVSLTSEVPLGGIQVSAGDRFALRLQATGSDPTTVRAKAWPAGAAEPDAWTLSASDAEPTLQGPGHVGFRAYRPSSTPEAVVVHVDDVRATEAGAETSQPAADGPPTAAFTQSCVDLTCSFDASGSSDAEGSLTYAWDFGDGATATGLEASHTYAGGGSYEVRLTVTDTAGQTDTATHTVTVQEPATEPEPASVADVFGRTVATGWGTADAGGSWSVPYGSASLSVDGASGLIDVPAGRSRQVNLAATTLADTGLRAAVALGRLPSSGTSYAFATVRGQDTESGYRVRLRWTPEGTVRVALLQVAAGGPTQVAVGLEVVAPGVDVADGERLELRLQAVGSSPTTLRAKVWEADTPEPTDWLLSETDTEASLQGPGYVGFRAYRSSSVAEPVVVSVDDLEAREPAAG